MPDYRLTPARKQGLAALLKGGGVARRSNMTSLVAPAVYWQTADWLVAQGLAAKHGFEDIALTDAGRRVAESL